MPFRQGKVLFIRFFLKMGHFLHFLTPGFLNDIHGRLTIGAYSQAPVFGYKKPPEKFPEGLVVWCARRDSNTRPTDS